MQKQKILLNNKLVWPAEPYVPNPMMLPAFVGREKEMELIMASWIAGAHTLPLSPVLVGEPGVGKNRIVYELARFTGRMLQSKPFAKWLACLKQALSLKDNNPYLVEWEMEQIIDQYKDQLNAEKTKLLKGVLGMISQNKDIKKLERVVLWNTLTLIAKENWPEYSLTNNLG